MADVQEKVLAIHESQMPEFTGFLSEDDGEGGHLDSIVENATPVFLPRDEAEKDPTHKQIIPYCLIAHYDDDSGVVSLFTYTRGKSQGEGRLHAKRSIGIGGHVNEVDRVFAESDNDYENSIKNWFAVANGLIREINEEVSITEYDPVNVGLLYDPSNEVGRCHLGFVYIAWVDSPEVKPNEGGIENYAMVPVEQLHREIDTLETWSQICLRSLFPGVTE